MMMVVAFVLSSCGSSNSDSEVEKKIAGTWTAEFSDTEDGIDEHLSEIIHYNATDHKFIDEVKYVLSYMGYTISSFTMYAEGTWSATKDELIEECNMDKVRIEFSSDYLNSTGMSESEARSRIMKELKGPQLLKLRIISDSEIKLTNSNGNTIIYHRK